MIKSSMPPLIDMKFTPNLLSTPIFRFDAEYLKKINDWLEKKIHSHEFRNHPGSIKKLKQKQQQFMELYDCAKIREREAEKEAYIKAKSLFYRTRLPKQDDRAIFDRLVDRIKTSEFMLRKNNAVSKI